MRQRTCICTAVLAIVAATAVAAEPACRELRRDFGEPLRPSIYEGLSGTELHGLAATMEGTFQGRFKVKRICAKGYDASLPGPEESLDKRRKTVCVLLGFHRLSVPNLLDVLSQWNGETVQVSGELNLHGGLAVDAIRLLERPASPAFCPGYEGPLEPSPVEDYYDHYWARRTAGVPFPDGSEILLHLYKAWAGYFPATSVLPDEPAEIVEFSVPAPYAGRDIVFFAAFDMGHFVYTLRDGRLYSWRGGVTQVVEEARARPAIYGRMIDGNVYYSVGPEPEAGRSAWLAVKRLTPELETETVWVTDTPHLIEWFSYNDEPGEGVMEITLRGEDGEGETVVVIPADPPPEPRSEGRDSKP